MKPIVVDSTQCHLWTDALHIRQLAREARNKWDRGTYVRMAIATAWIALEVAAQEALGALDIGYRFKENLDRAVAAAGLPSLDWSHGIWQDVRALQERRKSYVHRYLSLTDLFPETEVAEQAIAVVRDAIVALCSHTGQPVPPWLRLEEAQGWHGLSTVGVATITVGYHGAKLEDPNTVRISIVSNGEERPTTVLPLDHNPQEHIEYLLKHVKVPISAIRVYRAGELVQHLVVNMRGNS